MIWLGIETHCLQQPKVISNSLLMTNGKCTWIRCQVHGTVPFVTSFTFADNKVFVTTPSDGVLEWKDNKWNTLGDGLPQNKEQQIYPGISFIISFKNNLFIGFGTGKVWDTGMRGVWKYSLNN